MKGGAVSSTARPSGGLPPHQAMAETDTKRPIPSLKAREATFSLPWTLAVRIRSGGPVRSSSAAAWITQSAPDIPSRMEARSPTSPTKVAIPSCFRGSALLVGRTRARTSCPASARRRARERPM